MARSGTVTATRLIGIEFLVDENGKPKYGFESITFNVEQDIEDAEGPPVKHFGSIHPSNIQQQGIAVKALAELLPLLRSRFTPGRS